ncbi:MAG: flagellar hook-basal body complex protein FliE [Phycisphaerae bacterium]|nr:MAG: flagellar hook-basal body complex protein FliE [Planctomycetota bacterium]KAB2949089.1 MAG: flagellar hook-basal body complex protein FliE [Phycisphaerae bacterium]MBE7457122.1 flagellar hook-basal body complex protein FliE [Planctomycetia bacterium]MCK6463519.1 flagellar hook-basal body complex protein FliE [Phycisphaerae bacterium]MCL4719001.1 flagellar hook-basal body complex protein FliE [Phycisphaerae bacterium]
MIQGITNAGMIRPVAPLEAPGAGAVAPGSGKDFQSLLMDNLNEVNRLQREADQGVAALMTGETDDVAEVMTAVNKAGIAFDLLMEVRNKLLDAYREIQEMRV